MNTRRLYSIGYGRQGSIEPMGLLGVLLIDRQVGTAFYGEAGRMERDLLGDAAKVRILQLFGKLGTP